MSAAAIIAIAIGVVVVLAAITLRHARPPLRRARRRRAVGRDPAPRPCRAARRARRGRRRAAPTRPTVEAQGEIARYGTVVAPARSRRRPVVAARPRGARRQPPAVLQPGHGHADQCRPRRLRRGRVRRLPLADGDRRLRPAGHGRQARRHPRDDPHRRRLLLRARARARGSPSTRPTPCPRPRRCTPTTSWPGWSRASSPCTRSARTSAAASRRAPRANGSSARATARSTTRSARRRPARRRVAWTASRSPSAATATSPSTPASSSPARRSAPTPPARRPKARTASPVAASTMIERAPAGQRGLRGRGTQ